MTKHTPSPWKTVYAPGQAGAVYLSAPDGVIGLINVPDQDALLICAAPDLLAALKEMFALYEDHAQYDDEGYETAAINAARAAIARATGFAP